MNEAERPISPLRSEPKTLSSVEAMLMFREKGFFTTDWNEERSFASDLQDNHDGTISDHVTLLMWQQGGSVGFMTLADAKQYIAMLNQDCFAGFSDWRLPTLEEGASLLNPHGRGGDGLHIAHPFDGKQGWIWTADTAEEPGISWDISFYSGYVGCGEEADVAFVRACRGAVTEPYCDLALTQ